MTASLHHGLPMALRSAPWSYFIIAVVFLLVVVLAIFRKQTSQLNVGQKRIARLLRQSNDIQCVWSHRRVLVLGKEI